MSMQPRTNQMSRHVSNRRYPRRQPPAIHQDIVAACFACSCSACVYHGRVCVCVNFHTSLASCRLERFDRNEDVWFSSFCVFCLAPSSQATTADEK